MNAQLREKWRSSPCWQWYGGGVPSGYGRWRNGYAHRHYYEFAVGPIPDGTEIDHLCRNRGCVNPAHMEAVPHRVNMLRGNTIPAKNVAKTHCLRGHPFDEKNTRINKEGARRCRACNRGYSRQHNERVRAARAA